MFEYQLHELRHAELVRRAENEWLARHARRTRRTVRRSAANASEERASGSRSRRGQEK
ncbi:hypothetical protein [Streptomyces sp. NPDC127084]|uniref:hypothetical protein n=1 Tax=Streptomyces sp. NPDC127084 TaxID=3347133 RepID=UPI003669EBDD